MYKKKSSKEPLVSSKTSKASTKTSTKSPKKEDYKDAILGIDGTKLLKEMEAAEALNPTKTAKPKKSLKKELPDFTLKDKVWIDKIRGEKLSLEDIL